VEIFNEHGPAEVVAYISRDSNEVIALVHATKGGLPTNDHGIPDSVIQAARQRRVGFGEYVNEGGEIVRASFLPPATEA